MNSGLQFSLDHLMLDNRFELRPVGTHQILASGKYIKLFLPLTGFELRLVGDSTKIDLC